MADGIHRAYQEDISYRLYGQEPANNQGWRVNTIEISEPGLVYEDDNIKVEAFNVPHGSWPNALGYRFTTPDKVIVISGDTAPSETLTEYATGADVLIHEVYSLEGFQTKEPKWQRYHAKNHTSTHELAEIAKRAQPGLVILYHQLFWGSTREQLLKEMAEIPVMAQWYPLGTSMRLLTGSSGMTRLWRELRTPTNIEYSQLK